MIHCQRSKNKCLFYADARIWEELMKVAVLGYGVVGYGVHEMLKAAQGLEAGTVLVRPGKADADFKCSDIEDIVNDRSIDIVAEVMGGIEPAFTYVKKALLAGKHVVTSNKALVAAHGIELAAIARKKGAAFLFSAACGGAVPFLHNLSLAVASDKIKRLGGILNGTTNFMLDSMQRKNLDYADALAQAQALGYAEADPTADVSGLDALRKIMLACAVSYGILPTKGLCSEGIDSLTAEDVRAFTADGFCCRLLAKGGLGTNGIYAYVEPVLFKQGAAELSVLDNFNMAYYEAENSGRIVLMGQGAGRWPTASAVLRDISCIARGEREMLPSCCCEAPAENDGISSRYYVRCSTKYLDWFDTDKADVCGENFRAYTKAISVKAMHALADKIRKDGGKVFFAAIDE